MSDSTVLSAAKLRNDLISSYREIEGQGFYVVKNPSSEQFFRMREVEFFIARQLDGETPLEIIRKRVEEKFEAPLDSETLAGFIESLRGYGLIDTSNDQSEHTG